MLFSGCSFTYGDELENREKERFSSYFDSHNIGQCGICNDAIVRNTISEIEANPNKYDTIVVQFTLHTRTEVPLQDGYLPIIPQNLKLKAREGSTRIKRWQFAKAIYTNDLWTKYIGKENMYKNIFFMQSYLRMKGLKYVFLSNDGRDADTDSCWRDMVDSPIIDMHDLIGCKSDNPEYYSNDETKELFWSLFAKSNVPSSHSRGGHPNSLGHRIIASAIKECLEKHL